MGDITTHSTMTIYWDFPEVGGPARPKTAAFFPNAYKKSGPVNLLLYFHGIHAPSIEKYLADPRWPLREIVDASNQNVVFIAPTLADDSGGGKLNGDPDWYIDALLAKIATTRGEGAPTPAVGAIALAAHSGGGRPMFAVATGAQKYKGSIKQTWGFDCLYGPQGSDPKPWASAEKANPSEIEYQWGMKMPSLFLHYLPPPAGSTVIRSRNLAMLADAFTWCSAVVSESGAPNHDAVPRTHLAERLKAADFFA